MDARLLFSDAFLKIPKHLAYLYLLLRADAESRYTTTAQMREKTSGLNSKDLALRLNCSSELAFRHLQELVKRKYIVRVENMGEPVWELGDEDWYLESPPVPPPSQEKSPMEIIREKIAEDRKKIEAAEARKPKLAPDLVKGMVKEILKEHTVSPSVIPEATAFYEAAYATVFREPAPDPYGRDSMLVISRKRTCMSRCMIKFDYDLDKYKDDMLFVLKNWDRILKCRLMAEKTFTWKVLGSGKFWNKIEFIKVEGFDKYETLPPSIPYLRQVFDEIFMDRWGWRPVSVSAGDDDWGSLDKTAKVRIMASKTRCFSFMVKTLSDDRELALTLVKFLFDRWDEIAVLMSAKVPDYLMLNSAKFVLSLQRWHESGKIPEKYDSSTVAHRGSY